MTDIKPINMKMIDFGDASEISKEELERLKVELNTLKEKAEISASDRGIVVHKKDDETYEIINGRHKFLAAKESGLEKILVTMMPDDEKVFINLID